MLTKNNESLLGGFERRVLQHASMDIVEVTFGVCVKMLSCTTSTLRGHSDNVRSIKQTAVARAYRNNRENNRKCKYFTKGSSVTVSYTHLQKAGKALPVMADAHVNA